MIHEMLQYLMTLRRWSMRYSSWNNSVPSTLEIYNSVPRLPKVLFHLRSQLFEKYQSNFEYKKLFYPSFECEKWSNHNSVVALRAAPSNQFLLLLLLYCGCTLSNSYKAQGLLQEIPLSKGRPTPRCWPPKETRSRTHFASFDLHRLEDRHTKWRRIACALISFKLHQVVM